MRREWWRFHEAYGFAIWDKEHFEKRKDGQAHIIKPAPRHWTRTAVLVGTQTGPWHSFYVEGSANGADTLEDIGQSRQYGCNKFLMDNHNDAPPPSPSMSAPQNQLAMSLLNNLLQMQGLENTILNQQSTATTPPSTSSSSPSTTQAAYNPQLLLEQQIKLTQLQQLQQLQSQIFQQQVLFLPIMRFIVIYSFRVRSPLSVVNLLLRLSSTLRDLRIINLMINISLPVYKLQVP